MAVLKYPHCSRNIKSKWMLFSPWEYNESKSNLDSKHLTGMTQGVKNFSTAII